MLHLVYPNTDLWNYILADIPNAYSKKGVELHFNFLVRILRKLIWNRVVVVPFLEKKISSLSLEGIEENDSVLVLDINHPVELQIIARSVPSKCKLFLWFWNPIITLYHTIDIANKTLDSFRQLGYEMFTFDPGDARRYNIRCRKQIGRVTGNDKDFENQSITNDFYFLGKMKDRQYVAAEVENYLNLYGYNNNFVRIKDRRHFIPYYENIQNVRRCKCIVDIVQKGQRGLTLRPIEALFYKKKLLTNNQAIRQCDFYNSQNIFIWGEDPLEQLPLFMETPFKEIEYNIVKQYDIIEWIKYFEK